mgnify:CR=1 FL=1
MTGVIGTLLTAGFVAQVLRIAVPYVLAAIGGAVTERSGVVDLALEAKLLFGAFAAAADVSDRKYHAAIKQREPAGTK